MDAKTRIKTILLIEKIKADPEYAKIIAVTDNSHYRKDEKSEE